MKARDIIPGWPQGRSTLPARLNQEEYEEVFCCRSMAISIFPVDSLENLRQVPWHSVVPVRSIDGYALCLARPDGLALCEIRFCPWCGGSLQGVADNILRALEHVQTRDYHKQQQKMLDNWRIEQFKIDQFVATGGGADITREQYDRMFPSGGRYVRSTTQSMVDAARPSVSVSRGHMTNFRIG